jgi:hypothetical protein
VKVHWEVLTSDQQHVLTASATISQRWGAYLAGGAGLALQLGHRRSADFDWFTPKTLPPSEVLKDVQTLGLPMQIRQNDEGTFLGQVGGVDYSVFRYRYPLVEHSVTRRGYFSHPGLTRRAGSRGAGRRARDRLRCGLRPRAAVG